MHQNIWLTIHVGHGLDNVAQFDVTGDGTDARLRLRNYVQSHDDEILNGKFVERVIAPEILRNEKQAALSVLEILQRVRGEGKALSVTTFSHQLTSLLLNAAYEMDYHLQTAVVLHAKGEPGKSGEVTVHGLDREGCMLDWPYGVLTPDIDHFELAAIGFTEVHDVRRKRQEMSRESLREQGTMNGEVVTHICNHPKS